MNLRTSFAFCLVFVVWVVTCVFALTTYEHRQCLTIYPGTGTDECKQSGCKKLNPDNPEDHYCYRTFGIEHKRCGRYESYFLNCEQKEPTTSICSVSYLYVDEDTCNADIAGDDCHPGELFHSGTSGVPSCEEYSWQ